MEKPEILKGLVEVFDEIFENHNTTINETTTAQDIEEWDSLTNIELIVAVEKKFDIQFRSSEIETLGNVGDLRDIVFIKTAL
ncbi:MAG: acyl carrier protein [Ferruginibacter sp.]